MILSHDIGRHIELRSPARESPLWRYVYGGKPKPFFHPLCTPAGHVLSIFEPSDHTWHRGLWFTIKIVNGENFWEEPADGVFGIQQTCQPPAVSHDESSINLHTELNWVRPGGDVVLNERRKIIYQPLDQDSYALDFTFDLTPCHDVVFDRTPFTTWGGYGGLTFRGNRNWTNTKLTFADGSTSDRPTPVHSPWCDLTGLIDGAANTHAGVAMFDHPQNVRHPVGWYGGTGAGHYFNAALLFHESLKRQAGETLSLKYRVLVHDHDMGVDRLNAAYSAWTTGR